jgi:hypothetical protein
MTGVITDGNVPAATCRSSLFILKHTPSQTIPSEFEEVYGKDVISLWVAKKWTGAFNGGCTKLSDLSRSGRPLVTGKVGAVRA